MSWGFLNQVQNVHLETLFIWAHAGPRLWGPFCFAHVSHPPPPLICHAWLIIEVESMEERATHPWSLDDLRETRSSSMKSLDNG
jgi:hypothetical protein